MKLFSSNIDWMIRIGTYNWWAIDIDKLGWRINIIWESEYKKSVRIKSIRALYNFDLIGSDCIYKVILCGDD